MGVFDLTVRENDCVFVNVAHVILDLGYGLCMCASVPVCQCASVPVCQCACVPVCPTHFLEVPLGHFILYFQQLNSKNIPCSQTSLMVLW